MISEVKLNNYNLFCDKAKSYGVCDKLSGDDKHKRIHMGKDEYSRTVYYGCLRKDSMKVFYRSTDKVDIPVKGGSRLNVPTDEGSYDYYSDIKQADYDEFLRFVSQKLDRKPAKASQGINIPLKPKGLIGRNNTTAKLICPRCDLTFKNAPRCPSCGQLILL